jgi:2-polyprenyl-3-methyl-5-hydroxy-6-metoxy-1,4-benzoquinol methylase
MAHDASQAGAAAVNVDHKYQSFVDTLGSTHNLVVSLVPPGARVLEFGCATGYMSEVLRSRLACSVVGIEISAPAAEIARNHCERVIVGDAETLDFCEALGSDRFDVILFADVLEHLRDPGALLARVRPFLKEDGSVIASIPNVAHGSVRLALLAGEFRYRELGLLDDTHLRFFTRESIQDLFEANGYLIVDWIRKRDPIDQTEIAVPQDPRLAQARALVEEDHEATTYQFIVRAVPAAAELVHTKAALKAVREEVSRTAQAVVALEAQLAAARAERERERAAVSALAAQYELERSALENRLAEQARLLETTNAQLAAVTSSRAWRVARLLSKARRFVLFRGISRKPAVRQPRPLGR